MENIEFSPLGVDIDICLNFSERCLQERLIKKAFYWRKKAANYGHIDSQYWLATNYINYSYWFEDDIKSEAFKWLLKAAKSGCAEAYNDLAVNFYKGYGLYKKDYDKAKNYWIQAFMLKPYNGYDTILDKKFPGWRYENNSLLSFSEDNSLEEIQMFAELDILDAQYWYANCLYKGLNGCKINKEEAAFWFNKAAINGHKQAGISLEEHWGLQMEYIPSYENAVDRACSLMKSKNIKDQCLAFLLLSKAKNNGIDDADFYLGICFDEGIGTIMDKEKAASYYRKAAKGENAEAFYKYALCLHYGVGAKRNRELSEKMFLKAAKLGHSDAQAYIDKIPKTNKGLFSFNDCKQLEVHNKNGLQIIFCGLRDEEDSNIIYFKFWIKNTSNEFYNIWLSHVFFDSRQLAFFEKIGGVESGNTGAFFEVPIKCVMQMPFFDISLSLEVDNTRNIRLFDIEEFVIHTFIARDFTNHFIRANMLKYEAEAIKVNKLRDSSETNKNAILDIESLLIAENDYLRFEFGGIICAKNQIEILLWVRANTSQQFNISITDVQFDAASTSFNHKGRFCCADRKWHPLKFRFKYESVKENTFVSFNLKVVDPYSKTVLIEEQICSPVKFNKYILNKQDNLSDAVAEVGITVEQNAEAIVDMHHHSEIGEINEDTHIVTIDQLLHVENSWCKLITASSELQIYMPSKTPYIVKKALRNQGWRWNRELGCWYAKDSSKGQILASIIAGEVS